MPPETGLYVTASFYLYLSMSVLRGGVLIKRHPRVLKEWFHCCHDITGLHICCGLAQRFWRSIVSCLGGAPSCPMSCRQCMDFPKQQRHISSLCLDFPKQQHLARFDMQHPRNQHNAVSHYQSMIHVCRTCCLSRH